MLTAQLENQDPLNPLESQDFAVQLATFSNVEQQTKTNSLLEDVKSGLQASGLGDMSGWLGREARVTGEIPSQSSPSNWNQSLSRARLRQNSLSPTQPGARLPHIA